MFTQILAVITMNLRSIPQRLWMSLATVLAVAVVVAVLLAFLAMGSGFRTTIANSGSDEIAVVIRTGAQAELNSVLSNEQVKLLEEAPGVASDELGPIYSAELYLIVDGIKRSSQTKANLPFRGIDQRGLTLRDNVEIVAGRMFDPGKKEIVVGQSILSQFDGFELGQEVKLGQSMWQVVGVFSANGSAFESELWADVRTLQGQFNRGNTFQIMRLKLEQPGDVSAIKQYIDDDKRLNLEVNTEKLYYQGQTRGMADLIFYLGWPLAIAMALGALAGALNTMYNSVAQRSAEIATLRAIGFPSITVFVATLFESLVLSVAGGILGSLAAFVFFDGLSTSTMGSNFTQVVFQFDINAGALLSGIKLAVVIGFIGGVFPAFRAARLPVLLAFSVAS